MPATNISRLWLVSDCDDDFSLDVWHGSQEPWANWDILAGRFVSEFGMQGYPDIRTVDYWTDGQLSERFPQSKTSCSHNKAVS